MIKHLAWLVVVAGLGACAGAPPVDQTAVLAMDVVDSNGRHWSLRDSEAKPLLIDIWATWCAPCIQALPALQAFHEAHGSKIQLLGVAVDTQGWQVVEPVRKRHGLTYPIAVGPGRLWTDFGAEGPPVMALVHHGKVLRRFFSGLSQAEMEKELAEFLK